MPSLKSYITSTKQNISTQSGVLTWLGVLGLFHIWVWAPLQLLIGAWWVLACWATSMLTGWSSSSVWDWRFHLLPWTTCEEMWRPEFSFLCEKQPNREGCESQLVMLLLAWLKVEGSREMLMFSRNLSRVEGKGRDGRPLAETETTMVKGRGGVGVSKEEEEEATNTSGSFFSRSTARASVKKSRPHSWHSTLQVTS